MNTFAAFGNGEEIENNKAGNKSGCYARVVFLINNMNSLRNKPEHIIAIFRQNRGIMVQFLEGMISIDGS